jgi:uncharacterized protein YecE (DUF72 family)
MTTATRTGSDARPEPRLRASKAAALWARLTGGGRPDRATIVRWIRRGVRGIRLKGVMVGGRWCVTETALREFHDRINADAGGDATPDAAFEAAANAVRAAEAAASIERLKAIAGVN